MIVTNGSQTDMICRYLAAGKSFEAALETLSFEPDAPHYTPRISGMLELADRAARYKLHILKSADAEGSACLRQCFSYPLLPGLGHFLHTYAGDGEPLPSFTGEPARICIPDSIDAFAAELWENLDGDNKVSLYVRYANLTGGGPETRIINKNI